MLALIILLIFIIFFIIMYLLLNLFYKENIQILSRIETIKEKKDNKVDLDELGIPFHQRVLRPIGKHLFGIISKITPKSMKNRIEEKLSMAGNPYNLGISQWFLLKSVFGLILPIILVAYIIINGMFYSRVTLVMVAVIIILNLLPNLLLDQITKKRQKEIIKSLPDVLDLLTVSVEAGLSFDGALVRLVDKMSGILTDEFGRVLNEMRMGKGRRESLKDMSARCGVPDLTTLVGSLIQADELGVGITNVLRIQSVQMREKRRQRAQEKAMKAPIKILFPLILFIFPTIFVVLLGPAIIRIINTFMK